MSYRLLGPIIEVYAIKTWQIKPALSNEMPETGFAQNKPPSFNVNIDTFSQQQPYEQPSSLAEPPSFTQPPPYTQPPSYPPRLLMVNRQWRHRLHMYNLLHIHRHIINIIKLLYRNFEPCVCAKVFVSKFTRAENRLPGTSR